VPEGEQAGEPASVAKPAGERRILPGIGRGGAGAGVAAGAPRVLETTEPEENYCVTRSRKRLESGKMRSKTAGLRYKITGRHNPLW